MGLYPYQHGDSKAEIWERLTGEHWFPTLCPSFSRVEKGMFGGILDVKWSSAVERQVLKEENERERKLVQPI